MANKKIRDKFREEMKGVKCEGCGKPANSLIRSLPVCSSCFKLVQRDNMKILDKMDIPKDLRLYVLELDNYEIRKHQKFYSKWMSHLSENKDLNKSKNKK
jgi:hypothetical protein